MVNDEEVLELDGREVRLSSPGKVLFAERGETKRDLVDHYLRVGEPLLRTMGGRPVLMQRFPHGAGGPSFFQKRVPQNMPEWVRTTTVTTVNGTPSRALVIADRAHVVWAVNLGCLGFLPRHGPRALRRAAPGSRPAAGHGLYGRPPRGR
jgi:DNA primase